jgi:hypothetical protein
MKRIVNVGKPSSACAVLELYPTTAVDAPARTFSTLLSFDGTNGAGPPPGLVQATNGDLYGTGGIGGTLSGRL